MLRVVVPCGTLFVQANFSDRWPDTRWFRIVSECADLAQFRPEEEVRGDFTGAGWTFVAHVEVTWLRSANLAEDDERLKLRSISGFDRLSTDESEAGFARIEEALSSLADGPQYETSGLLVFQRRD